MICRAAVGLQDEARLKKADTPALVVTSPPYAGVHVLYHRWQVEGRRETPAPYWLAALSDGHGASHYTFGSRTKFGLDSYFKNIEMAFASVRQVVGPDTLVAQLVAFSDAASQLPSLLIRHAERRVSRNPRHDCLG
ncbi:DNA modification methylase (fragment) [Candidatus Sulfopaludibacter sp. SbA6]